jgi:hypothetical protein
MRAMSIRPVSKSPTRANKIRYQELLAIQAGYLDERPELGY